MTIRSVPVWVLGLLGLALASASPAEAGSVARGKAIAERWCVLCHVVGPNQSSAPADGAPSFLELSKTAAENDTKLRSFLVAPHPPMPNLSLSRREIDDVLAYIASLKPVQ
jgi:mono/diheme cytochrome c family protein